jgi:CBS domain-containing protein
MNTTVADIMNRELVYLADGARAELARGPILAFGITAVPILDEDERPVGVVSLRDLLDGAKASRGEIATVEDTATVHEAAERLGRTDYHHLVVVDRAGRAVGMVSALDLLRALVGQSPRHPSAIPAFTKRTPDKIDTLRPPA